MKINLKFSLFFVFLFTLISCQNKEATILLDKETIVQPPTNGTTINLNLTTNDEIYMGFSELLFNLHNNLNSNIPNKTELDSRNLALIYALGNMEEDIPLSEFIDLHASIYQIDKNDFEKYFTFIFNYKSVFTSQNFQEEYLTFLDENLETELDTNQASTRWFLAALGNLLGGGACLEAVLSATDAAAYVASGILTSPTGLGAVAVVGGAVTSYGNAFVAANECMYP